MSCFFCRSKTHRSLNCDIYVSNAERKRAARSKLYCSRCLTRFGFNHFFTGICESKQKCYICFSKRHHTFFCPERIFFSSFFLPDIDELLIHRFFELLDPFERYLVVSSTPKASNLYELKPLKIVKDIVNINNNDQLTELDSITVVTLRIRFRDNNWSTFMESSRQLLQMLIHKRIIMHAKTIELEYAQLRRNDFFCLLSTFTEELNFQQLTIIPTVTFAEVLEKAPYSRRIKFNETNIEINNFWPETLLENYQGRSFGSLTLLVEIDFDVSKLVTFIKTNCVKNAFIHLYVCYYSNQHLNYEKFKDEVVHRISEYFCLPSALSFRRETEILIETVKRGNNTNYSFWHETFVLRK